MKLKDMLRAVREYPALSASLESAQSELRQTQQALEQSEKERQSLDHRLSEQSHHVKFLAHKSAALQTALTEFCPQLSSLGDMKRFYHTISSSMDQDGFTLYHMAEKVTGLDVYSSFPYEDSCGMFEEMKGPRLLRYLTAAYFHAVDWTVVPGTTYEIATLRKVDTYSPEYQAFERQLYEAVLERMGFRDMLALSRPPHQPKRGGDTR